MSDNLAKIEPAAMAIRVASDPVGTFDDYRRLQHKLDAAMPEAIISIKGKSFRRKPYWRAIARGFNLTLEITKDEFVKQDFLGGGEWGFVVTYRATAPNGCSADGDGACFASELKGDTPKTVHNVRSRACTRAFARAVSNLVGFGEVSAEEVPDEPDEPGTHDDPYPGGAPHAKTVANPEQVISEPQRKRLYAISKAAQAVQGWADQDLKDKVSALIKGFGYDSSTEIQRRDYEAICTEVESWK